jgi:hypothetical protein
VSNRREFLQMSLAASAFPVLGVPGRDSDGRERVRASSVVVEATSPLALRFRDEAVRLGLRVHAIKDDITELWYHEFSLSWPEAPAVVAGVTLSTSLFCLETLARDHGMRVWFRAAHRYLPKAYIQHVVAGPDQMVQQAGAFGPDWPVEFARLASALPLAARPKSEKQIVEPAELTSAEPGPMVSWIIAPRLMTQPAVIS